MTEVFLLERETSIRNTASLLSGLELGRVPPAWLALMVKTVEWGGGNCAIINEV